MTIAVTAGTGGFEVSARTSSGNAQAGTFIAGTNSNLGTSGAIQYARHSSTAASWSIQWTPPATNVGNVILFIAGVSGSTFTNSYTLTPAAGGGSNTLSVSPSALTFSSSGSAPPSQSISVSSSGSAVTFTTSVSTVTGGNWLTAASGGTTPMSVAVSVNPTGLAAGTYTGSVTITSSSATNSPRSVGVTLTVTSSGGGGGGTPTLTLSPSTLTFKSTAGASVAAQAVQVASGGTPTGFAATVATTSGGNWLAVNPGSGTTPAAINISAMPSGMANGTYSGSVTFTPAGSTTGAKVVGVTLIISPAGTTGGTPPALSYNFTVLDSESSGTDWLLLDGSGAVSNNGRLSGSGNFIRFNIDSAGHSHTVSMGTFSATKIDGFTRGTGGAAGVLTIDVLLSPIGAATSTATLRIADSGSDMGVTFTPKSGPEFDPSGTGRANINLSGRGGSGGGGDDN